MDYGYQQFRSPFPYKSLWKPFSEKVCGFFRVAILQRLKKSFKIMKTLGKHSWHFKAKLLDFNQQFYQKQSSP